MVQWTYFNKAEIVWNDERNDHDFIYKGYTISDVIITSELWERFNDYCEEKMISANGENFETYLEYNQSVIEEVFENAIENYYGIEYERLIPLKYSITSHESCDCESKNLCYYVATHESEKMDDEVDSFILHGDEYEVDDSGSNALDKAYEKAVDRILNNWKVYKK